MLPTGRSARVRGVTALFAAFLLAPSSPALAQDDDLWGDEDLLGDEEETSTEDDTTRLEEGDDLDLLDEPDDIEEVPLDESLDDDLLGDEPDSATRAGDSEAIYRATLREVAELDVDEEVITWEQYLQDYPNSAFRGRIEARIEELMDALYGRGIERETTVDAQDREIDFAQGLLLENLDPRTRIQAGFEWGLPDYMNLFADYEHQVRRDLSFHGGVRRRYTGWSLEGGARYAFVKSTRTQTIVSVIADLHLNMNPAWLGFRPQLAAGKRFADKLDVQVQLGPDLELRASPSVRLVGGANVTYRAAETVALFGESTFNMKNFFWPDGGTFRFNALSFGMKFYPELDSPGLMEVNVGASVPYTSNYWMYHFGSIMGQVNYYL